MSSIGKEMFLRAHERLVEEYQDRHPEADWSEAYEKTTPNVMARVESDMADLADSLKDQAKERSMK
jgi:hypothetical protein